MYIAINIVMEWRRQLVARDGSSECRVYHLCNLNQGSGSQMHVCARRPQPHALECPVSLCQRNRYEEQGGAACSLVKLSNPREGNATSFPSPPWAHPPDSESFYSIMRLFPTSENNNPRKLTELDREMLLKTVERIKTSDSPEARQDGRTELDVTTRECG